MMNKIALAPHRPRIIASRLVRGLRCGSRACQDRWAVGRGVRLAEHGAGAGELQLGLSRNPKASFVALNAVGRPGQLRTQRPVGALASISLVIQTPSISSGRFHVDGRSNAHGWIV